jgi:hypothetical protein
LHCIPAADQGGTLVVVGRVFRGLRMARILYRVNRHRAGIVAQSQKLVSQNKRRFVDGSVNLDLTYINGMLVGNLDPV